jgi:transcriptional regulator of acetoin/glycerol metabolism
VLVLAEPRNDLVRERWARVERLGLRRESDGYPEGTTDADLLERRDRVEEVFREERDLVEGLSAQLATGPRVVLLADREGVILSSRSDRQLVDPVTRVRLVAGARWGEETRGTNAIGTALVEGRGVGVVGAAHYELRNRNLFCYATPLRDAYGDVVAVLDVSGPIGFHDAAVGVAVQAAGVALERAIRAVGYGDSQGGALGAIERLVTRAAGPSMLIEASGLVRVVNAAARRALPISDERRLSCERVFGVSFAELVAGGAARGGMRFETAVGTWRIEMDTIAGRAGRPLAVVVCFEAERAAPPVSRAPATSPELAVILGEDAALLEAKEMAARFAATPLPVLLLAETGTGKELFARAIHASSERRARPFVAVNCGALSPALIASELFGYAPGAFTGAARGGSEGRIAAAHGGTLFLDEIAEMPESLQAALLRVLDDGVLQRVGEARERKADFRLICATCRDLPTMVASGRFRNDLFYRIQGACVTIPALRDRSDAVWLAERFLERLAPGASLSEDAAAWIDEHAWPGNVRELKSAMAYAAAMAAGESTIGRSHLPRPVIPASSPPPREPVGTRKGIVREAIESTLRACAGNVSEAARRLGVGRGTIYRALKDLETKRLRLRSGKDGFGVATGGAQGLGGALGERVLDVDEDLFGQVVHEGSRHVELDAGDLAGGLHRANAVGADRPEDHPRAAPRPRVRSERRQRVDDAVDAFRDAESQAHAVLVGRLAHDADALDEISKHRREVAAAPEAVVEDGSDLGAIVMLARVREGR